MREILFIGKRKDNGEWVEGDLLYNRIDGQENERRIGDIYFTQGNEIHGTAVYDVIPETVGQYIGITDKNGKRIFEGDIVRADNYIFCIKYGKCGGVPNAEAYGYMGFYLDAVSEGTKICVRYGLRDDICYFSDILVIGNIHDNPELLS